MPNTRKRKNSGKQGDRQDKIPANVDADGENANGNHSMDTSKQRRTELKGNNNVKSAVHRVINKETDNSGKANKVTFHEDEEIVDMEVDGNITSNGEQDSSEDEVETGDQANSMDGEISENEIRGS